MKIEFKGITSLQKFFKAYIVGFLIFGLMVYLILTRFVVGTGGKRSSLNIILISVDTLRADHLSCYRYYRQTSPNIDEFAKKGVVFRNTASQSTATLPSHTSIFTSRYASQHKAIKMGRRARRVEETEVTLAEILKKQGYITAAFTDGGEMAAVFNIDQGFDIYNDKGNGIKNINQKVFKWLEKNRYNTFFLFVHCYDPHIPYVPPPPFHDLYLSNIDKNAYRGVALKKKITNDRNLQEIIALYDGEIAYTDKNIGELLCKVDELDLADRTLIIFTSDHGEEFMEHSGLGHARTVYDEVIMVPLIFKNERLFQPREIKNQVRSIDIAPTVLDILNIPIPNEMMGKSLLGLISGKNETKRIAFSENEKRNLLCCRNLENKLILRKENSREEFYDLKNDPGETNILPVSVDDNHPVHSKFREEVTKWRDVTEATAQPDKPMSKISQLSMPEEVEEKLRSLGYLQ
ncbi:MAG: sulfatase [Candidatus Lokiarchaeia archaeon]